MRVLGLLGGWGGLLAPPLVLFTRWTRGEEVSPQLLLVLGLIFLQSLLIVAVLPRIHQKDTGRPT